MDIRTGTPPKRKKTKSQLDWKFIDGNSQNYHYNQNNQQEENENQNPDQNGAGERFAVGIGVFAERPYE